MKTLMMTVALVIATGCTTVGSTSSTVAQDEADKPKKSEEGLRDARQQALLEALEGKKAQ